MKETTERAELFFSLESKLNSIKYHDVQIGSLMALHLGQLFREKPIIRPIMSLTYAFYLYFMSLIRRYKIVNFQRKVLYFKTGSLRHHNRLEEALSSDGYLKDNTLIISSNSNTAIDKRKIFQLITFSDIFEIWSFLIKNRIAICSILKEHKIKNSVCISIFFILICQLSKVKSLLAFFRVQSGTLVIGGDYDRGVDTAVWFATGRSLKLKSFTLQHGVINPPYGYNPIIADEIWVWGEMAKKQLIELGVDSKAIRITGTPIIEKIQVSHVIKNSTLQRLYLNVGRTIVLALSTPDKLNDIKLVTFFKEIQTKFGQPNDNFLVKIHPARETKKYSWITRNYNFKILPNTVTFQEFVNIVDILLVHSSGIATESIQYDIKVGVIDILPISPGNGLELHKHCGVPILKDVEDFLNLINYNVSDKKEYILDCFGSKASRKIAKRINEKLDLN